MSKEEAYKILGVKEDASKDVIIKKYNTLQKKYKMSRQQGNENDDISGINKINDAYNLLMGLDEVVVSDPREEFNSEFLDNKLKRFNIDSKKINNFIYYYKYHVVAFLIALVVIIVSIKSCDMTQADFGVAIYGQVYIQEQNDELLKTDIKSNFQDIKEPFIYSMTHTGDSQYDSTMMAKLSAMVAAQEIDIIIGNSDSLTVLNNNSTFANLDEFVSQNQIDKSRLLYLKEKGTDKEHAYGIEIDSSKISKEFKIIGDKKFATIVVNTKNKDKADEVLKYLIEK